MAKPNVIALQKQYVLDCIDCVEYDEKERLEIDISEFLTDKGKLQYFAHKIQDEFFSEWELNRAKGDYVFLIKEYLQGLPHNFAFEYEDIDNMGKEWEYDLSSDKKISDFRNKWHHMIATRIYQMLGKEGIDLKNPVSNEFEYKSKDEIFYIVLKDLCSKDKEPRFLSNSGPFAREYAIPATRTNIALLKKIEMFVFDTVQMCDNKEHPDFGKEKCFFAAPKMEDIVSKLEELQNNDCSREVAELLKPKDENLDLN